MCGPVWPDGLNIVDTQSNMLQVRVNSTAGVTGVGGSLLQHCSSMPWVLLFICVYARYVFAWHLKSALVGVSAYRLLWRPANGMGRHACRVVVMPWRLVGSTLRCVA